MNHDGFSTTSASKGSRQKNSCRQTTLGKDVRESQGCHIILADAIWPCGDWTNGNCINQGLKIYDHQINAIPCYWEILCYESQLGDPVWEGNQGQRAHKCRPLRPPNGSKINGATLLLFHSYDNWGKFLAVYSFVFVGSDLHDIQDCPHHRQTALLQTDCSHTQYQYIWSSIIYSIAQWRDFNLANEYWYAQRLVW